MKILSTLLACIGLAQLAAVTISPQPEQNYMPLVIVNNTGQPSSEVYFVSFANDMNGRTGFLVPNATTGQCSYAYPLPILNAADNPVSSITSSVALSDLPQSTALPAFPDMDCRVIYIPISGAARAYFSIQNKLYLSTSWNGAQIAVNAPSVDSPNDPNYFTLYQFIEFGLTGNGATNSSLVTFPDVSYVDYFCLPIRLYAYSYPSNTLILSNTSSLSCLPSGTKSGLSRSTILTTLQQTLQATGNASWSSLGVPFYEDPYTYQNFLTDPPLWVRIVAAKHSINLATSSVQFTNPGTPASSACTAPANGSCYSSYASCNPPMFSYFCPYYATNIAAGGAASFMTALTQSLFATPFYAQITPAWGSSMRPPIVYEISATSATSLTLTFNQVSNGSGYGPNFTLLLGNTEPGTLAGTTSNGGLTTEQLLSGGTWTFINSSGSPDPGSADGVTSYTNELSKLVSALFSVGYWPFPTQTGNSTSCNTGEDYPTCTNGGTSCPFYNSQCGYYFLTYFANSKAFSGGLWYNLYCQALHQLMTSSSTTQSCLPSCNPPCTSAMCAPCGSLPGGGCVPNNPTLGLGYAYDFDDLLNMSGTIGGLPIQDAYANASALTNASEPYLVVVLDTVETDSIPVLFSTDYNYNIMVDSAPNGATVQFSYYDEGGSQHSVTASPTASTSLGQVYVSGASDQYFTMTISFTAPDSHYSYSGTFNLDIQHQIALPMGTQYTGADEAYQSSIIFGPQLNANGGVIPGAFLIQYNSSPPSWPG